MLTLAFHGCKSIGFAYFVMRGGWAYYFSGASHQKDLGLALIWLSMLALKDRDVRWCELGWQGQAQSKKETNLEFMKRGFGGRDIPVRLSGLPLTDEEWRDAACCY